MSILEIDHLVYKGTRFGQRLNCSWSFDSFVKSEALRSNLYSDMDLLCAFLTHSLIFWLWQEVATNCYPSDLPSSCDDTVSIMG